jgi:hypothetical protein
VSGGVSPLPESSEGVTGASRGSGGASSSGIRVVNAAMMRLNSALASRSTFNSLLTLHRLCSSVPRPCRKLDSSRQLLFCWRGVGAPIPIL